MNAMQKHSGARIQINQNVPDGAPCPILITGSPQAVQFATYLLNQVMEGGSGQPNANIANTAAQQYMAMAGMQNMQQQQQQPQQQPQQQQQPQMGAPGGGLQTPAATPAAQQVCWNLCFENDEARAGLDSLSSRFFCGGRHFCVRESTHRLLMVVG